MACPKRSGLRASHCMYARDGYFLGAPYLHLPAPPPLNISKGGATVEAFVKSGVTPALLAALKKMGVYSAPNTAYVEADFPQ